MVKTSQNGPNVKKESKYFLLKIGCSLTKNHFKIVDFWHVTNGEIGLNGKIGLNGEIGSK